MAEKYKKVKKDISPESGSARVRALSATVYSGAIEAKERGELVCWSASNFPPEILAIFDIPTVYPESHAAAVGARRGAQRLCEIAESDGYSNDICAYARLNLAFAKTGECEEQPMPLPDFVACCNNICSCMVKWYENLAVELGVPLVLLDIPFNTDYDVSPEQLDYMRSQFYACIEQLEEITGKKWDEKKFQGIMDNVTKASHAWVKAVQYANNVPALFNGQDIVSNMGGMVTGRIKPDAAVAYNALCDDYQKLLEAKETTYKGEEQYRILMDGITVWPYLRYVAESLAEENINATSYVYGSYHNRCYTDLDSMLVTYASVANCVCMEHAVDNRLAVSEKNNVDGYFIHTNRSCKLWSGMMPEISRQVAAKLNVPVAVYDGDQADPRAFSKAQFETRLQGLVEMMEVNKQEKEMGV